MWCPFYRVKPQLPDPRSLLSGCTRVRAPLTSEGRLVALFSAWQRMSAASLERTGGTSGRVILFFNNQARKWNSLKALCSVFWVFFFFVYMSLERNVPFFSRIQKGKQKMQWEPVRHALRNPVHCLPWYLDHIWYQVIWKTNNSRSFLNTPFIDVFEKRIYPSDVKWGILFQNFPLAPSVIFMFLSFLG